MLNRMYRVAVTNRYEEFLNAHGLLAHYKIYKRRKLMKAARFVLVWLVLLIITVTVSMLLKCSSAQKAYDEIGFDTKIETDYIDVEVSHDKKDKED